MATSTRKRTTTFNVTGILPSKGGFDTMPGMVVTRTEVKVMLLGGGCGVHAPACHVPGAWSDVVCEECGESAHWCTKLSALLPVEFVSARRNAD